MAWITNISPTGNSNKFVTWLNIEPPTKEAFCNFMKIRKRALGDIVPLNEASMDTSGNPFLLIGKIVKSTPRLHNEELEAAKRTESATCIFVREFLISANRIECGNMFKVVAFGKIAEELQDAKLHVGDRIALIRSKVIPNIDWNPSYSLRNVPTPVLGVGSSVIICNLPSPSVNKSGVSCLRCDTPDSSTNDELDIFPENKVKRKKFNKLSNNRNNVLKERIASSNIGNNDMEINTEEISIHNINSASSIDTDMDTDSVEQNFNVTELDSARRIVKERGVHSYLKIKDINKGCVKSGKFDMFVIVVDVRRLEEGGRKKRCLITKVIDDSCTNFKSFTLYIYYEDQRPKVEPRWILRIRYATIEEQNGILIGKVLTSGCIVSFSPVNSDTDAPITTRRLQYEITDCDAGYVERLRNYIVGKNWSLMRLMDGFYPDIPDQLPHLKLAEISHESWFTLSCEIVSLRIFFDSCVVVLTVKDNTQLRHSSYQFPKECKLWPEVVMGKGNYLRNADNVNIIIKNMTSFDDRIIEEKKRVRIHYIQILREEVRGGSAMYFFVDASKEFFKIEPAFSDNDDDNDQLQSDSEVNRTEQSSQRNENNQSNHKGFVKAYTKHCGRVRSLVSSTHREHNEQHSEHSKSNKECGSRRKLLDDDFDKDDIFNWTNDEEDYHGIVSQNTKKNKEVIPQKVDECVAIMEDEQLQVIEVESTSNENVSIEQSRMNQTSKEKFLSDKIINIDECEQKERSVRNDKTKVSSTSSNDTVINEMNEDIEICSRRPISSPGRSPQRPLSPTPSSVATIEKWLEKLEGPGIINLERSVEKKVSDANEDSTLPSQSILSPSQRISEVVQAGCDVNTVPEIMLPIGGVNSYNAIIWELTPPLTDNPLDIVSGLCEDCCDNFFLYSTLKLNSDNKLVCPECYLEGKESIVKLIFLFEVLLILQTGHSVIALVHGKHANKLLSCTEEEYLFNDEIRNSVISRLKHCLGSESSSSFRYTPPFQVCLLPVNHTLPSDQNTVVRFCLIDTTLPVPSGADSLHTLFANQ